MRGSLSDVVGVVDGGGGDNEDDDDTGDIFGGHAVSCLRAYSFMS